MRLWIPLLALACIAAPAVARDDEGPTGAAPVKNFSNIHAETDWVMKAFGDAEAAVADGDWTSAVRMLQIVVDQRRSREAGADAAPYVRAVYGTSVYEGAWIVARHMIARGGDPAVAAYEREYGATAKALFERAGMRRERAILRDLAARFLPLATGRRAALMLVDLALERDDKDAAFEWLEALEDLEAVSTESKAALAPWRAARIRRQALALARDAEALPGVEAALASADPAEGFAIDAVPQRLRQAPDEPRTWPTTGGDAARSALPGPLGSSFRLRWFRAAGRTEELADSVDPQQMEHDRPSLWLPPRAVATERHLFVSDGQHLHIYDLDTGARVLARDRGEFAGVGFGGLGVHGPEDRRLQFGLLEGHALTVQPVAGLRASLADGATGELGPGHLVFASVPDGRDWGWDRERTSGQPARDDHIEAYHWDGAELRYLWRVGGYTGGDEPEDVAARGGLPDDTRLYGAPAFYRGRVWVAGIRPAQATQDRWEVWIYSVDPATGRVTTRTHLGTGTPMRTGRMDEVIPTSPAAANGRVVVSTALGILAAVDADDGRVQWIHRYDRNVETERGRRRNRDSRDRGLRTRSFCNEPPILALDRCFVAPTDSNLVLTLFDRPRTRARRLVARGSDLYFVGWNFMPEQIAGVAPGRAGPPALVLVGKGESGSRPGSLLVVHDALAGGVAWPLDEERERHGKELWRGGSPTGFGAEPYGRALVTTAEVFVPQAHGIAIYELEDRDGDGSHYLGVINRANLDEDQAREAPERPYGNLIPVPGRGLVAVSATTVAFWEKR